MYRVELDGDVYPPGGAKWQVISPLGQTSPWDYFISGSFVKNVGQDWSDLKRLVILSIGYIEILLSIPTLHGNNTVMYMY